MVLFAFWVFVLLWLFVCCVFGWMVFDFGLNGWSWLGFGLLLFEVGVVLCLGCY